MSNYPFVEEILKSNNIKYLSNFNFSNKWIFHFALYEKKIAIEIQDRKWIKGRHTYGQGFSDDILKYNTASLLGWVVVRFTPIMLNTPYFLDTIKTLIK